MRAKDVCREIERRGGIRVRQEGSHRRFVVRVDTRVVHVTVPMSKGDLATGTLYRIQRELEPAFGKRWLVR